MTFVESACVLRRVELNRREITEGQLPWSVRQTALYRKLEFQLPSVNSSDVQSWQRSTSLLIAPSQSIERRLSETISLSQPGNGHSNLWALESLLSAESLKNWIDYMAWLEERLRVHVRLFSK